MTCLSGSGPGAGGVGARAGAESLPRRFSSSSRRPAATDHCATARTGPNTGIPLSTSCTNLRRSRELVPGGPAALAERWRGVRLDPGAMNEAAFAGPAARTVGEVDPDLLIRTSGVNTGSSMFPVWQLLTPKSHITA